jgi:VCBS repeat protein
MYTHSKFLARIGLVMLISMAPISTAQISFFAPKNYPVGSTPRLVDIGDFNNDGKKDLAVVDLGNPPDHGNVSLLLGNGDGTFAAAVSIPAGKAPRSVAVADFNADGKLDLAVADFGDPAASDDGKVILLLGNGGGSFQSPVTFAAGKNPSSIAVGDFNRDNAFDLVTSTADAKVSVLLGNGNGTFQPHVDYPSGSASNSIVVADINADGFADVALARAVGAAILLGNGDGTFQPSNFVPVGLLTSSVTIADFDRDGKPDVAAVVIAIFTRGSSSVELLRGNAG